VEVKSSEELAIVVAIDVKANTEVTVHGRKREGRGERDHRIGAVRCEFGHSYLTLLGVRPPVSMRDVGG
jgi:hypothetical protein